MDLKDCFDWVAERLSSLISPPSKPSRNLWGVGGGSGVGGDSPFEDLKQLGTTMHRIQALIRDFEENPLSSSAERFRLKELKDVAYDADDVLEEYAYHLQRAQTEAPHCILPRPAQMKAPHPSGFSILKRKHVMIEEEPDGLPYIRVLVSKEVPKELVEKAEKILKEYDNINTQWDNLRLREADGDMKSGVDKKKIIPTSSLVHETEIFGRVNDKEKVIEMIFAESAELCSVSVLPIVGMAGIGKTTLAQLVYNDPRVCESFDLHGWVFVGGNFDVETLTKKIVMTFTRKNCDLTELNELHKKLEEVVRGKRFFLVLDDVSNDTTRAWGTLLAPLVRSQYGRVVVTAHDKQVAKIRQKRSSYFLGYLPSEDCWSLFRKLVFEGKEYPHPVLLKFGKSIVEKCKGLPLAVKAIGTSLFFENDEEKWNDIVTSDLWELGESGNGILPALELSYYRMPIHLKQCFVLFSLFPKGHVFSKDKIIRLWMSLGLLEESQEKEDFGNRCIGELSRFSMIQNSEDSAAVKVFSLHDIVHCLAQSVAGEDFMMMDQDILNKRNDVPFEMEEISKTIRKKRYLSMIRSLANSIGFQILNESNKMRILQLVGFNNHCMNISIPNELFHHLTHLRALDFSNILIGTLPESIGYLIQLRSLVLTNTGIEKLPEAIFSLLNLQTLDLMGCPIQELPEGINNLFKLRHLIFENSHYIRMASGTGKLLALRTLPRFDIGKGRWHCRLSELNNLVNLEGELCIGGLENAGDVGTVMVSEKVNILRLDWSSGEPGQCKHDIASSCIRTSSTSSNPLPHRVDSKMQDHVFEMIRPKNSTLKELHIQNYQGSVFPTWLGDASFTSLAKISLVGMQSCESLPSLGQLPSLKSLSIQSLWSVELVGCEFCCHDGATKGFPSLEYLEFFDMLNWVKWSGAESMEFSSLNTLRIIDCPSLTNLPEPLSSSLTKLVIKDCGELTKLPALPSLTSLTLKGELNQNMFSYLDFPSLRTLKVCYSSNIRSLVFSIDRLMSLEVLVIHTCRNLESVSGFGGLNSLKLFKIYSCRKVKFAPAEEIPPSVQQLDISGCPMLQGWELFHKRKLMVQLNNDGGAEYEQLEARAELSEADSDADDSQLDF